MIWTRCLVLLSVVAVAACGRAERPPSPPPAVTGAAYHAEIEQFRRGLEERLTSDTGWLTIAGLAFLTKPQMTFGSDPGNDIVLPGATPAHVGRFVLGDDGHISVTLERGVTVKLLDGTDFTGGRVKTDSEGPPDRLVLGDVQVWVHMSGDRPAVRIRDKNNALRKTFTGRTWYPVSDSYRIEAKYVPYQKPRELQVPNLLGDIDTMVVPGQAVFTLNDREYRMLAVEDGDELWFIFKDLTSGESTYPAARFLYTPPAKDGKVVLDFNRAESPPCAFNPYATCPLPPPENRLQARVEAGEQYERH